MFLRKTVPSSGSRRRPRAGRTTRRTFGDLFRPGSLLGARAGRVLHAPVSLLLLGIAFVLAGCEEDAGPLPANLPPETYLLIQGADLDTTNYRQILRWWGSDPDGRVIGYCIHWDGGWTPPADAQRCAFDEEFVFTTATTDTFVVPTEGTFAERTFSVHSVDDDGIVDPDGRSQLFRLGNWAPELSWSQSISRPTLSLPAVTFASAATDLDGNGTVESFRIWLDGEDPETSARVVSDSLFALGVDDFDGRYGERTLYVQAVDEARTRSNIIQHTWTVEPPPDARLLLIDGISIREPGQATHDSFYRAVMDSIAPGDYFVYDVALRGNFRSQAEVAPLFELFEGVLWYGGGAAAQPQDDIAQFHNLGFAETAIPEYLDAGGNMLIIYQSAIGDSAGFTPEFARDVAGVDGLYRYISAGGHDLQVPRGMIVASSGLAPTDSLETTTANTRSEFMIPAEDAEPLFWVAPGFLDPNVFTPEQTEPALLGIATSRRPGRIGVVTFLLSAGADRRGNAKDAAVAIARDILE